MAPPNSSSDLLKLEVESTDEEMGQPTGAKPDQNQWSASTLSTDESWCTNLVDLDGDDEEVAKSRHTEVSKNRQDSTDAEAQNQASRLKERVLNRRRAQDLSEQKSVEDGAATVHRASDIARNIDVQDTKLTSSTVSRGQPQGYDSETRPGAIAVHGYNVDSEGSFDDEASAVDDARGQDVRNTMVSATVVEMDDIENELRDRIYGEAVRASQVNTSFDKDDEDVERSSKQKKVLIVLSLFFTLFAVGGMVSALVAEQPVESQAPTQSPTSFDDVFMGEQEKLVFDELLNLALDGGASLRNVSSPQYKAFKSLGNLQLDAVSNQELRVRYGLATLYHSTNGDQWTDNTGWLDWETSHCTDWFWTDGPLNTGNYCDDLGQLRSLRLAQNNLQGTIPPEVALIGSPSLVHFALDGNDLLTGSIPDSVFDAYQSLRRIKLDFTSLSGSIPTTLGRLSKLASVWLGSTNISGSLPTEVGQLASLSLLDLSNTRSLGPTTIPTEVYSMSSLKKLTLEDSQFTGTLSSLIGQLTNLDELTLNRNALTGAIPDQIGELSLIGSLDFENNRFTGTIPSTIDKLTEVVRINLHNNELTGAIPSSFCNMTSLEELRLHSNRLTGQFPTGMERMTSMMGFDAQENQLSGTIPFEAMANWKNFRSLRLDQNMLTGPVDPGTFFWQLPELFDLHLESNLLTGSIPATIGLSPKLDALHLASNFVTGSIPTTIGNVTTLRTINLSNNDLRSTIPSEIVALTGLAELILYNNTLLSGTLPASDGMSGLQQVELTGTSMVGEAAPFVCNAEVVTIPCATMTCACCNTIGGGDICVVHAGNDPAV